MSHQHRDRGRGVRGSGGDTRGGRWNTRGGAGGGSGGEGGSGGGGTSRGHGRGGAAGDSRGESRGRIGRGSGGRGSSAVSEGRGGGSGFSGGFGRGTRGDSDRGRGRAFRGGRGAPSGPIIFAADSPAIVDARLSNADQDGVVRMFRNLEVTDKLPLRPGYGTLGKAVILRANFFPLNIPQNTLYDYQVDISPAVKKEEKQKRSRIFELIESSPLCTPFGDHIAHDRSERLVSSKELPQPLELRVVYQEAGQATGYDISIVMKQKLDPRELTQYLAGSPQSCAYNPLPLTSALNLVLQMSPSRNGVRVGQNRFFFRDEIRNLALGVDAWKGFYSSLRPTYNQLMVNVNVCMAPFYVPGNLGDALVAFKTRSIGGMLSLPEHFARHLKVTTSYLGYKRRKPLTQIMDTSARRQTFFCEEMGRTVSVEEYFKHKYNITLEHADDLPVVNTGAYQNPSDQKRSGKKGRQGQANYIPAELCVIDSGLPYAELNEKETAAMIKIACNPPIINAKAIIDQGFPSLGISPGALASPLPGFGIEISAEMTVIPARELPPPRLTYRSGRPNVSGGSWNILNVEFHRGAVIRSWWVMVIQDPDPFGDPELKQLVDGFRNKCVASGMTFPDGRPRPIVVSLHPSSKQDQSRSAAIDQIRQELKRNLEETTSKPNLILVLLSRRDKHIYPGIKRLGDVELGLQTVHMLLPNALKGNDKRRDQYFSNVALKVNTKLNGINHMLDPESMRWLTTKKTIIVGMDVTHPGPRSKEGSPSIAAVVASVDDDFVQFPASLRIQKSKDEMVGGLAEMMAERLSLYKEHNGSQLPERVLFYRDGVSEGQFEKVLKDELPLIYKSFEKFDEPGRTYRPKLTIIVCGKRHHARFYPTTETNADLNGNTRPGTVVDKGVTSVFNFDFYLQAHAGLQGTVRPTHYTVIYDENRLGADEVQQGTNTISYLYARATKAVSLVPAAYYADLACERGRFYINNILNLEEKSSSGAAVTQKRGKAEKDAEKARVFKDAEAMWGEGVHKDLRKTMFYI